MNKPLCRQTCPPHTDKLQDWFFPHFGLENILATIVLDEAESYSRSSNLLT